MTGSKETLQWAARENVPITPGLGGPLGFRLDVVRFYAACLAQHGHQLTPDHLVLPMSPYVADSREQAIKEAGPYTLYFNQTLFSHGNITEAQLQQQRGYLSADPHDYVRPEHRAALSGERSRYRDMTRADLERNQALPWGRPEEVRDKLIAEAEGVGANTLLLNFNRGAMPHAMFMEQLRRFGAEVLPTLQAHQVTKVPV